MVLPGPLRCSLALQILSQCWCLVLGHHELVPQETQRVSYNAECI